MNASLLKKAWRETWLTTLLLGAALGMIEGILSVILPAIWEQMGGQILQIEFVASLIRGLLAADVGARLSVESIAAFAWVHPVVLALVAANAITVCTRFPAGEVDSGTADLLLSLPVTRLQIVAHEGLAWLAGGVFLIGCAALGHMIGSAFATDATGQPGTRVLIVCANFFCFYVALAGLSCLASACVRRRGHAIAVMLAVVLASLLINFLTQMWAPAGHIAFLSLLAYYRPFVALQGGSLPTFDMAVLLSIGLLAWTLSAIKVVRRDI